MSNDQNNTNDDPALLDAEFQDTDKLSAVPGPLTPDTVREISEEDREALREEIRPLPRKQIPTPRRVTAVEHSDEAGLPVSSAPWQDAGLPPKPVQLANSGMDGGRLEELLTLRTLVGATHLDLSGNPLGAHAVVALAGSADVSNLVTLNLGGVEMGDEGAVAIANSPYLANLNVLQLPDNGIGPQGVAALAGSASLLRLTTLDLSKNPIKDAGAGALAEAKTLVGVKTLLLARCAIKDNGLAQLAAFPYISNIETLDLRGNGFGDKGFGALADSPLTSNLKTLDVSYNQIGAAGARAFFGGSRVPPLDHLEMTDNALGDKGAAAIARSFGLAGLDHLLLSRNGVGNAGADAIASSTNMASVERLVLAHNKIGSEGAAALARSTNLTRLSTLDLSHNPIFDAGAEAFAASESLTRLDRLDLSHCGLTSKAAAAIAAPEAAHLERLSHLDLRGQDMGEEETALVEGAEHLMQTTVLIDAPGLEAAVSVKAAADAETVHGQLGLVATTGKSTWGMLAYLLGPLGVALILMSKARKNDALLRYHAIQSLGLSIFGLLATILTCGLLGLPVGAIAAWYGVKALKGAPFEIPLVTSTLHKRGAFKSVREVKKLE